MRLLSGRGAPHAPLSGKGTCAFMRGIRVLHGPWTPAVTLDLNALIVNAAPESLYPTKVNSIFYWLMQLTTYLRKICSHQQPPGNDADYGTLFWLYKCAHTSQWKTDQCSRRWTLFWPVLKIRYIAENIYYHCSHCVMMTLISFKTVLLRNAFTCHTCK